MKHGVGAGAVGTHSWSPYAQAILGAWLLVSPSTFGYAGHPMAWSDWGAGAALILLASAILFSRRALAAQWVSALVGSWLLFAPLALWAPAQAYMGSMLAGSLAIVFATLLPRVPIEQDPPGPEIPPGWNYNPSARPQRAPIIAMAFLGFFLAQYMAAFQLGYHDAPWDPFFGDGTRRVLTSDVSEAFPVSDAGLGAFAYLIEALTGFAGGPRRWRTMPWMVILFGFLVVPAGVISILLIILQPVAVGAWCTFCLLTALTTLLMISPAADEVVATLQFLARRRRAGESLVRAFWLGGPPEEGVEQARPEIGGDPGSSWIATALGINAVTPTLAMAAAVGVWLMFSPTVFGMNGGAADTSHLVGPLVVTFSVIALADIGRVARWVNVPLGLWLGASPWLLEGFTAAGRWNTVAAGLLVIALSIPKGKIRDRFAGFNRYIV